MVMNRERGTQQNDTDSSHAFVLRGVTCSQAALVAEMQRVGQDARRSIMILATLREAHDRFQQEVEQILKELKRNTHP